MGYEYTDVKDFIEDKGVPEYDMNLLVAGLRTPHRYKNALFKGNPNADANAFKYQFADPMIDPSRNQGMLNQQQ